VLTAVSRRRLAILKTIRSADAVMKGEIPDTNNHRFVFAGTKRQELSDMSLTAVLRRMNTDEEKPIWVDASGDGITVHGFRSTYRM